MKKMLFVSLIGLSAVFPACRKADTESAPPATQPPVVQPGRIQVTGLLKAQGVTVYMYGTHVLTTGTGSSGYALKSTVVNLDPFIDKTVTLTGNPVPGYPVDFGPPYLDVQTIK